MTEQAAEAEVTPERSYRGVIVIEWPNTRIGTHGIPTWMVSITDAETGEPIHTASSMRLDAQNDGWVYAELTQLIGPDGEPAKQGAPDPVTGKIPPVEFWPDETGRLREGTFRYLVSEMRVRKVYRQPERQRVALDLKWTEDGQERGELFGPWIQGDPETEEGAVAHMMAAQRFTGEWRRLSGQDAAEVTAILLTDPDEWVREKEQGG